MSDIEDNQQEVEVQEVEEETKADNINDAIKSVIKKSQANDGLVKGLNEVLKALDRKQALICVLASDCEDMKYKKFVTAMAKSSGIPLIEVDSRMDLGEWLGHCHYDKEGNARKVKGTSSVAIRAYGEETEDLAFVLNHIKEKNL
mmetsp:Transcript_11970/g.16253  ORF Transcript_11970/g.16253 Transcript_11970/m.16253 type:complete len:145 (+) Transcript_11970:98-532(+)|eukprot:CAMPEP_0185567120 /NCGR_PEP_ID=MMETSP0434-20130131/488_1 /TAXON_ID=626734 ORGANISM="Favella taraikaensis, Strain Fe Narragansett Bay" /NCGR_SAMPLE_ID=MMETSP0434 /ASSEMBLY_ACC=CAM_ASM_000379 /LENGTH=144 /DNA_ID=CAMNT_0028181273 /DNA_START=34 /DNA_END=468 /DNA_ORIENTATION=+